MMRKRTLVTNHRFNVLLFIIPENDFVSRSNVKPSRKNTESKSTVLNRSRSHAHRSRSLPHQPRPRRRRKPQNPKFRQHPLPKQPPWLQSLLKKIYIDQPQKHFKIIFTFPLFCFFYSFIDLLYFNTILFLIVVWERKNAIVFFVYLFILLLMITLDLIKPCVNIIIIIVRTNSISNLSSWYLTTKK